MIRQVFSLILLLYWNCCLSQGENNLWLLSRDIALDFEGSLAPEVFPFEHQMNRMECSTVACDSIGNLLFYSDGANIWNRNNDIMPNGEDLGGHYSASQGILAIRSENDADMFHIMSLDALSRDGNRTDGDLYHSVVDMSLNGGYGDVTEIKKNQIYSGLTEMMTGYPHPCGGSWILVHERDNAVFKAFHLYNDQINDPVSSEVGAICLSKDEVVNRYYGQMKLSPDGSVLALISEGVLQFFQFDISTGRVSNLVNLVDQFPPSTANRYYSGCFSPSGNFFYINSFRHDNTFGREVTTVVQVSLEDYHPDSIRQSRQEVGILSLPTYLTILVLASGPDGRIYINNPYSYDALSTIEFPDKPGTLCQFSDSSVPVGSLNAPAIPVPLIIGTRTATLNLPADTLLCNGESLTLDLTASQAHSIRWEDGTSGLIRTIDQAGIYSVLITNPSGCALSDSIRVDYAQNGRLSVDTTICEGDLFILNQIAISVPGTYYDTMSNSEDCELITEYQVDFIPTYDGDTIHVHLEEGQAYTWLGKQYIRDGLYEIIPTSPSNCYGLHYLEIESSSNQIFIPNAISPNGDGLNDFLTIYGLENYKVVQFDIFDRWGGLRYRTLDTVHWTATKDEIGVYLYLGRFENIKTGKFHTKSGTIYLIK